MFLSFAFIIMLFSYLHLFANLSINLITLYSQISGFIDILQLRQVFYVHTVYNYLFTFLNTILWATYFNEFFLSSLLHSLTGFGLGFIFYFHRTWRKQLHMFVPVLSQKSLSFLQDHGWPFSWATTTSPSYLFYYCL